MSLECSDTERWSHWQRPAFARRVAVVWAAESEHQGSVVMRNKDMSEKINVTCDHQILTLMFVY